MPQSEEGIFQEVVLWILGATGAIGAGITGFLNGKIDNKVSKEVFEEFKDGNAMSHYRTHQQLKGIQDTQDKIFEKLDGKKDKDR